MRGALGSRKQRVIILDDDDDDDVQVVEMGQRARHDAGPSSGLFAGGREAEAPEPYRQYL